MRVNRIVQVSSYFPPHLGGQENAVHDLASHLAENHLEIHVVTSSKGSPAGGTTVEKGMHITRLRGIVFGHAPIMPSFLPELLSRLRQGSIIHLHIGQAFTPEMVWLASKISHTPYIAQLHIDFEPSGPAGILLPLYKRFVLRRVIRSAASVIVLNKKTWRIVRSRYAYKGKIHLISNGITESYFRLQREKIKTPPRTLRLLFVGRLSKQKNVPILLEALLKTRCSVHVDIIGEGDQANLIQKIIREKNLKNVTLHGRINRDKVMKFYQKADALIMPSLYEAQPLVLLEAMAARLPIIGTDVIGVAEHIKNIGIIVEPSSEGITKGIEQFYRDFDKLPAMVERGYIHASQSRWPQLLKKYEEVYAEALAD